MPMPSSAWAASPPSHPSTQATASRGKPTSTIQTHAPAAPISSPHASATKVFIGLEPAAKFFKAPTQLTGTPARPEILNLPSREAAAAKFGLDPEKTTLLVTGGSQGALQLNRLIAKAAPSLPENIQILHIAGPGDFERHPRGKSQTPPGLSPHGLLRPHGLRLCPRRSRHRPLRSLHPHGNLRRRPPLHPRSIPFAADDHQTANAEVFSTAGAAQLIQEKDLNPESLAKLLTDLLTNPGTLNTMSEAAEALAIPDAAEQVTTAILA